MASLLLELVSPSLWWLWELVIVANVWMLRSFLPVITKDQGIFVEPDGDGGLNYLGSRYIDRIKPSFRIRKGLSFYHEGASKLFRRGSMKVILYNKNKARPIVCKFKSGANSEEADTLTMKEIPHNPKGKKGADFSLNPSSDAFDDFVTERAYEQGERANKTQKKDIAATLVYAIMAGLIGGLVGYLIGSQPHYPAATVGLVWSLIG